jgi:hypothetical protein
MGDMGFKTLLVKLCALFIPFEVAPTSGWINRQSNRSEDNQKLFSLIVRKQTMGKGKNEKNLALN